MTYNNRPKYKRCTFITIMAGIGFQKINMLHYKNLKNLQNDNIQHQTFFFKKNTTIANVIVNDE